MRKVVPVLCGALALAPTTANAQQSPEAPAATPAATPAASSEPAAASPERRAEGANAEESEERDPPPGVHFHGNVEASYGYNFNEPSNEVTAWRWYDARHNTFGLQSAMLSTEWNAGPVKGKVQLQFGVLTELFWDGGRSPEQDILWRLLQEVTAEWTTPYRRLSIEGGAFNVPFGPEYNVAYLNWNWSTSNLFALMPYQIAGFRANVDLGRGWTARAGVYNGWDQIVRDNNSGKSFMASLEWEDPNDEENYFFFNYMVGDERARGDERGPYARHTFDLYGQWHPARRLFLRGHVFSGFEPTRGDTLDGWVGAALFAKVELTNWFSVAARGDVVRVFSGASGSNLFFGDQLEQAGRPRSDATLMGSATLTLDAHPNRHVSVRLEARHDRSDFPLFFRDNVPRLPMDAGDQANESNQTTLTAGLTTWF